MVIIVIHLCTTKLWLQSIVQFTTSHVQSKLRLGKYLLCIIIVIIVLLLYIGYIVCNKQLILDYSTKSSKSEICELPDSARAFAQRKQDWSGFGDTN